MQLLVDRARVKQRDLQQIVLNESLTVAPKLTPDQLDALSLIFILKHGALPRVEGVADFHLVLDDLVLPFVAGASHRPSAYQHLEYVGCAVKNALAIDAHIPFTQRYPGLFTKGFPADYGFKYLKVTEAQQEQLTIPARHKVPDRPDLDLVQINATDDEAEDELIERLRIDPGSVPRLKQLQKENLLSLEEVRGYLIETRHEIARYFDIWAGMLINSMTLTTVGIARTPTSRNGQAATSTSPSGCITTGSRSAPPPGQGMPPGITRSPEKPQRGRVAAAVRRVRKTCACTRSAPG